MAKSFSKGINSLLVDSTEEKETTIKKEVKPHTFAIKIDILKKIKAIAYWDRLNIQDVINDALCSYINEYEKKNGKINNINK